jgi:hypothetical protein
MIYLKAALAWLAGLPAPLPESLFVLLVFGLVYVGRQCFPKTWESIANFAYWFPVDSLVVLDALRKAWQAAPAMILGAVLGAVGSGGDVAAALYTSLLGLLAVPVHEIRKAWKWDPYKGATPAVSWLKRAASKTAAPLVLCLALVSCGAAAPERAPCRPQDLAELEAQFQAESVTACLGYGVEACPYLDGIRAKYQFRREAWIQCSN